MTRTQLRPRLVMGLAALTVALTACRPPAPLAEVKDTALERRMRALWEDHVAWTRLYIVSAAARLPETEATAQRLLGNQEDIGNAIRPFYGDSAGDALTALLKAHITIATEVIGAAMAGDTAGQHAAAARWGSNADEIAALLSGANPGNWPLADMQGMLHAHLDLTTREVTAHLGQDWAGSVAAYDRIKEQALEMADALSAGIRAQFPGKVG
jgi:hypothetical protein